MPVSSDSILFAVPSHGSNYIPVLIMKEALSTLKEDVHNLARAQNSEGLFSA